MLRISRALSFFAFPAYANCARCSLYSCSGGAHSTATERSQIAAEMCVCVALCYVRFGCGCRWLASTRGASTRHLAFWRPASARTHTHTKEQRAHKANMFIDGAPLFSMGRTAAAATPRNGDNTASCAHRASSCACRKAFLNRDARARAV